LQKYMPPQILCDGPAAINSLLRKVTKSEKKTIPTILAKAEMFAQESGNIYEYYNDLDYKTLSTPSQLADWQVGLAEHLPFIFRPQLNRPGQKMNYSIPDMQIVTPDSVDAEEENILRMTNRSEFGISGKMRVGGLGYLVDVFVQPGLESVTNGRDFTVKGDRPQNAFFVTFRGTKLEGHYGRKPVGSWDNFAGDARKRSTFVFVQDENGDVKPYKLMPVIVKNRAADERITGAGRPLTYLPVETTFEEIDMLVEQLAIENFENEKLGYIIQ
jgi:hypothetical protein